jgi:uncharacterized protein (TIGR02118 family)
MFYPVITDIFVSIVYESAIIGIMHKLVILIQSLEDENAFDERWPEFLRQAEAMPGLLREASCRVDAMLFGQPAYTRMHELYFDNLEAAGRGLASPQGQAAGRLLQALTGGRMTLFFAEHKEDQAENLLRLRQAQLGRE